MTDLTLLKFGEAVLRGDSLQVRQLLTDRPDLVRESLGLGSWLHLAAQQGSVAVIEVLCDNGLDLNASSGSETPLDVAARHGRVDAVRWMLDHGARIAPLDSAASFSGTLSEAITGGSVEVIKLLAERGMDLTGAFGTPRRTPLQHAEAFGYIDIANFLRANGAHSSVSSDITANPREEIVSHFRSHLGPTSSVGIRNIVTHEPTIEINYAGPSPGRDFATIFTVGMSSVLLGNDPLTGEQWYAEFMIHLPVGWEPIQKERVNPKSLWIVEWIQKCAEYCCGSNDFMAEGYGLLANGNPPKPLADGFGYDSWLFFCHKSDFAQIRLSDTRLVRLLTLFPLYPSEREVLYKEGIAYLLQLLDNNTLFPLADPDRPSALT